MAQLNGWSNIRVRKATHARLMGLIESLRKASELGLYHSPCRHLQDISLNDAIVALLDRDDAKRRRSRESKARQRQPNVPEVNT